LTGYYLMHRGWMDNDLFRWQRKEPYCSRAAWVWLIEHAQYEPAKVLIGGKPVELQRGQLSHSYRYLARAWGWSEAKVRRWCVAAASLDMIRRSSNAGQVIITICNYDKYQADPRIADAAMHVTPTHRRRNADANTKEGNEGKDNPVADATGFERAGARGHQKERSYGPTSRKTRISTDWQPDLRDVQYAQAKGWDGRRIGEEADAFADRCSRDGATYADWHAAWRTWCRNADKFAGRQGGNGAARSRAGGSGPGGIVAALGGFRMPGEMD